MLPSSEVFQNTYYAIVIFEDADPDLSDSEYLARVMPPKDPEADEDAKEADDDDAFAAAIARAVEQRSDEEEDEDESGSDDEDDEEGDEDDEEGASDSESASGSATDEDEDDEEYSGAKKLVDDEIRQLESAIAKKNADIAKVTNVALKVCFSLLYIYSTYLFLLRIDSSTP